MEFWVKIADIVSSKRFYGPIVVIIGVIFIYKIINCNIRILFNKLNSSFRFISSIYVYIHWHRTNISWSIQKKQIIENLN